MASSQLNDKIKIMVGILAVEMSPQDLQLLLQYLQGYQINNQDIMNLADAMVTDLSNENPQVTIGKARKVGQAQQLSATPQSVDAAYLNGAYWYQPWWQTYWYNYWTPYYYWRPNYYNRRRRWNIGQSQQQPMETSVTFSQMPPSAMVVNQDPSNDLFLDQNIEFLDMECAKRENGSGYLCTANFELNM